MTGCATQKDNCKRSWQYGNSQKCCTNKSVTQQNLWEKSCVPGVVYKICQTSVVGKLVNFKSL